MKNQKLKKQYEMFDLEEIDSDIWYWNNTISCPEDLISLINNLDENENSYFKIPKWETWKASNDLNTIYGAVKMIKSDSVNIESSDKKINQNTLYIINSITMAVEMCFNKYIDGHSLNKEKYMLDLSYLPIKRWDTGSNMGPHSDSSYSFPKLAFTAITYFNDDYEGGEIEFPEKNIKIKPKAGSTIIFPSNLIHSVKTILNGNRYMSTSSVNMI